MPFKYHPPTRNYCKVCEELEAIENKPIIDSHNGKASSAGKFPIHNWYYFVLGYSPEFPDFLLEREKISSKHYVVDPFMGTGTTLICCKNKGISSAGVDANDFFVDAARAKLNWKIDIDKIKHVTDIIFPLIETNYKKIDFGSSDTNKSINSNSEIIQAKSYANLHRMDMLKNRYISDKPFARWNIIKEIINQEEMDQEIKEFFDLAIASILVQISNVRYGPGFGVGKPKDDIDVFGIFKEKVFRMVSDLSTIPEKTKKTPSEIIKGDSREISKFFNKDSIDFMITSPPYPGDHEYTKHTRLELIAMGYAENIKEFRVIKKRMVRGSTTNVFKDDDDRKFILDNKNIQKITTLIEKRLIEDGATSGFEKLYTKLVWEYFGGMYLCLNESYKILKPGGKISLLVSDSHAFKMVHIKTAEILGEIGEKIGFQNPKIELWQDKVSTSHRYNLRENILTLTK